MLDDPGAHRGVVLAQHVEQLLGLGGLGEGRVAAEVAEHGRHRTPVAGEQPLPVRRAHQRGHLRREEPRQLLALPLHRGQEPRVLVAQPLVGEARPDARLQDRGPDGPGQVVDRPHADAAHDPVQLVEPRHDDHRDRREGRVRLHGGERLEAVEHRHHDVEQDEVDRPVRRQPVQRLLAVLRLQDLVAEVLQELPQGEPVDTAVVDDQDLAGPGVGHGRHPAARAAASASTTRSNAAAAASIRSAAPAGSPLRACSSSRRATSASATAPTPRLLPLSVCA